MIVEILRNVSYNRIVQNIVTIKHMAMISSIEKRQLALLRNELWVIVAEISTRQCQRPHQARANNEKQLKQLIGHVVIISELFCVDMLGQRVLLPFYELLLWTKIHCFTWARHALAAAADLFRYAQKILHPSAQMFSDDLTRIVSRSTACVRIIVEVDSELLSRMWKQIARKINRARKRMNLNWKLW